MEFLTEDFIEQVKTALNERDWNDYVDSDGDVSIASFIDVTLEEVFEKDYGEGYVPDTLYVEVEKRIKDFVSLLETEVRDWVKDCIEYQCNPLRYHGMKQSDFI